MSSDEQFGAELHSTLEGHETAVKRSAESFGQIEAAFERVVSGFEDDDAALELLEPLGRALEAHESQLETVVETLDDHKRVLRQADDRGQEELAEALERARRRARQESGPPDQGSRKL